MTPRTYDTGEQLPLLLQSTPSSRANGDATLIDIANQHEQLVEPEPVIGREFWKMLSLVYPVVVTSALEFLPGMTCTILAGHMDSPLTKEYVDATTMSTMFANISSYSIGFGLSSALDTLCSQAYGAKRYEKIGIYFQSGLLVISACLVPIFLLNWYAEGFLLYLGQEPHVAKLAQDFSRYMLPGVPFVFLYELFRKALQAQNIMQPLVVIALIGNIVNIVAGYVLAYHTPLGFAGIAISRALGNIVLPLLLIPYFQMYPQHLAQWWCDGWNLKEALAHVGLFLKLGIPGLLQLVMEWWAFEIISLMAGVLPNSLVAMSAHAVLLNVTTMLYMVFVGFSVAANIRVGNCLGANEPKKAQMVARLAMMMALGVSFFVGFALFTLRSHIAVLFISDPASIEEAATVLLIWSPMEVLDAINCVIQGIFRGAGKQDAAATTNAVAYYAAGIPLAALLGFKFQLGIEGLWLGFGLGVIISAGTLVFLFNRWKWDELAEDAQARTADQPLPADRTRETAIRPYCVLCNERLGSSGGEVRSCDELYAERERKSQQLGRRTDVYRPQEEQRADLHVSREREPHQKYPRARAAQPPARPGAIASPGQALQWLPGGLQPPEAGKLRAFGQILLVCDRAPDAEQRPVDPVRHEKLSMTSLISMSALFSHSLVALELSSCKLARQAGIILSQSLPSCTALRKLTLADNNLRDGGLRAIVDALKLMYSASGEPGTKKPTGNNLNGNDASDCATSEPLWTGLEELDISRNGITAAGFGAFTHVPIRNLIASDNAIEGIGPFLLTNASIRGLNLSGNLLSDEGAHELINTLFREQTSLEILDLRTCALSPSATSFLRRTLRQSVYCPLKELLLDEQQGDNPNGGQCLKEILEVGAQKYPHLIIRLSKAAAVPVGDLETRHPESKRGSSSTADAIGSEALVFPLAEGVQDTVVTTIAAAKVSLAVSTMTMSAAKDQPSADSARVVQPQYQPQQLTMVPLVQNSSQTSRDPQQQATTVQLQHVDVEYIVSKTIECMNQNFEQRLGLFLMKMEIQQQEKNASQIQFLAAKVDACERAIPRLEARLDVLSNRVAASNAQLTKLQNEFQPQLHQVRQDVLIQQAKKEVSNSNSNSNSNSYPPNQQQLQLGALSPTTPLSLVMQNQVEDFVATRARASEQFALSEIQKLRREANPQAIVDAVSSHLTQFKQEFDANQSSVLCRFTESIVKDSVRLDERMGRVEKQIENLETVIQAEQQASLLALEAISDAFSTTSNSDEYGDRPTTPSTAGRSSTPTRNGGGPTTTTGRRR